MKLLTHNFKCASVPADKCSFWCASGLTLGLDEGKRYIYLGDSDESTCSRIDLEKKYFTKLVPPGPKVQSLWTFGEGRQGKEYRFVHPYCWSRAPLWGSEGEFYYELGIMTKIDVYRHVSKE